VRFVVIDHRIPQERSRESSERLWTVGGICAMQGCSAFEFILQATQAYFRNQPHPGYISL